MSEKIKLVIFDMDGLVFNTERMSKRAWAKAGGERGMVLSEKFTLAFTGMNIFSMRQLFNEIYHDDALFDALLKRKREIMRGWQERDGIDKEPGLDECIAWLKAHNLPIALASSSGRETIDFYLSKTGMTGVFDKIFSGNDVKISKPNPEIFLKTCAAFDIAPANALVLEDSVNGILAAQNGGIRVVHIPDMVVIPPDIEAKIYCRVDTLAEIPALVEKVNK